MLAAIAREAAQAGGIEYLDAWHLTHAHWWASWDGMHYSQVWGFLWFLSLTYTYCFVLQRMSNLVKDSNLRAKEPRWMGGASMMSTQVLINAICNACS